MEADTGAAVPLNSKVAQMNLEDVKVHLNTHTDEAILVVGVLKFEVKYTRAIWGPMSCMLWRKLVLSFWTMTGSS